LIVILSIISLVSGIYAQEGGNKSESVQAVWEREELYWRLTKSGDIENYRKLWDEDFRGWPCRNAHTAVKSEVGKGVLSIKEQKIKFSYSLTYEGAADFGDVVVIYYQTPMIYEYPDGRIEGKGRLYKFTHTWRKSGKTWLIIGGMCAELPPTPKQ
jgi:hypothetical protein